MSARLRPVALELTRGWLSPAGQRRLQNRTTTMAANFVKNSLTAGPTGSLVAEFLAAVFRVATFQQTLTSSCTDMLSFKAIVRLPRG